VNGKRRNWEEDKRLCMYLITSKQKKKTKEGKKGNELRTEGMLEREERKNKKKREKKS
jgi:hypothetical protein